MASSETIKIVAIGEKFSLPRLEKETFKKLLAAGVLYENYRFSIPEEKVDLNTVKEILDELGYILCKECKKCGQYIVIDYLGLWRGHDCTPRYNDFPFSFENIEYKWRERNCVHCNGRTKGLFLTFRKAVMKCRICGERRDLHLGEEKVKQIEDYRVLSKLRYLFR